ncbi:MAG: hypothetical protein QMD85_03020 [Candidatus Aenigmarchaeota archaeon]|nr:hypothetical protein [Candidatus Aenigmarchaeota archaeon]
MIYIKGTFERTITAVVEYVGPKTITESVTEDSEGRKGHMRVWVRIFNYVLTDSKDIHTGFIVGNYPSAYHAAEFLLDNYEMTKDG